MDDKVLSPLVMPTDQCPKDLRMAVDRWKRGEITNDALSEASYAVCLDRLDDYQAKPLPTVPEGARSYRALSREEKRSWSLEEIRFHKSTHAAFYAQEQLVLLENLSNRLWLRQVLSWAQTKGVLPNIIAAVRVVLSSHEDAGEPLEA